ncbi:MAG: tetratricopeptide repeat protein [Polyangia bacterium]
MRTSQVTEASGGAKAALRLTIGRALAVSSLLTVLVGFEPLSYAKKEKGPLDEVVEKYQAARAPKKDGPPGPVTLSPDDCKKFAGDFVKAGEKEKGREADGLFNAGAAYDACGLEKDAEPLYRKALEKNPKHQPSMNNLGAMFMRRGDAQRAMEMFENAIRADPKSPGAVQAYNNKGALLFERAKQSNNKTAYDEAIGQVRRALAIDAQSMAAYQVLAQIYFYTAEADRSKLKLAQLVCDEAKKINPDYAPIYNTLGLIKLRSKDVTGALTEFRKAATLDPALHEAQLNIAAISLSARSYKQAEDAFQAVLKKLPNHFDATVGMGVALRGQRKADEAEQWYNKATQLPADPKDPTVEAKKCGVLYNLGLLYQDYKGSTPEDMNKGKDLFNKFLGCERRDQEHITDARRRIKDIDDTFKALEEQKKLEAEMKEQMKIMEQQQKLMEEQMKKQQEQQGGAAGGAAAPAPAPAEKK